MNFPCASPPSLCPAIQEPVIAYSAEVQDGPTFIGMAWNNVAPPLGKYFPQFTTEAICESQVSQQAADQCAQRLVVEQSNPCIPIFQSAVKTVTLLCPDGSPYYFTSPAGIFEATSQSLADQQAQAFASQQITGHPVCLPTLPGSFASLGIPYSNSITATGTDAPFFFTIVSGSLPPGIVMSNAGVFSGTPTALGNFIFTLQAQGSAQTYTQKTYSITVFTITTTSPLPDGFTGTPYSQQIMSSDLSDQATWSIASGALPNGLSLNSAGVISGSPTIANPFTFTVRLTIGGVACLKQFTILVHGLNWDNLVWSLIFNVGGTGFAFSSFIGSHFSVSAQGSGGGNAFVRAFGTVPYVGATLNCQVAVTVTSDTTSGMGFIIQQDGVQKLLVNTASLTPPGNYVFPFTLAATLGSTITVIGLIDEAFSSRLFVLSTDSNFGTYSAVISNV